MGIVCDDEVCELGGNMHRSKFMSGVDEQMLLWYLDRQDIESFC
jgi:hypothetical protein